jgi:cysteine desulfuration protein SufE
MNLAERQKKLVDEFSTSTDWEDRYKRIIDAGKTLQPYPDQFRRDKYKVSGCQSQVWLYPEKKDGHIIYYADSDALITKGLIALLLQVYSDAPAEEIVRTNPDFISQLGLQSKLTPSRANGLNSMVKQIRLYALAYMAQLHSGKS